MELSQTHPVPVSVGCRGNSQLCSHFSQLVCLEVFFSIYLVEMRVICIPLSLQADWLWKARPLRSCPKLLIHQSSFVCH